MCLFSARNDRPVENELHYDISQQMRGKCCSRDRYNWVVNCLKSKICCAFDVEEMTIRKNTSQLYWLFIRLGNYFFSSFLNGYKLGNAEQIKSVALNFWCTYYFFSCRCYKKKCDFNCSILGELTERNFAIFKISSGSSDSNMYRHLY